MDAQALSVVLTHAQALSRGAVSHWLGVLEVSDVDQVAARFVERGAMQLGPKWVNPQGLEAVVLRDPGGAVIALGSATAGSHAMRPFPDVAACARLTVELARTKSAYAELLGFALAKAFPRP